MKHKPYCEVVENDPLTVCRTVNLFGETDSTLQIKVYCCADLN